MATSVERVHAQTPRDVNARIQQAMRMRLAYYEQHRDEIDERLAELDEEWDIERAIESNASTLALAGTLMGLARSGWYFALPVGVMGFLLQHSIQGWCPPVPILRRLGFRTEHEIDIERNALRTLRGDFDEVSRGTEFDGILSAFKPLPAYRGRVRHQPERDERADPERQAPHEFAHAEDEFHAQPEAGEREAAEYEGEPEQEAQEQQARHG